MKNQTSPSLAVIFSLMVATTSALAFEGVKPTPAELEQAAQWLAQHLKPDSAAWPFSFIYGGQPCSDFLKNWPGQSDRREAGSGRTQQTRAWTDPKTGLEVRCVAVTYADFPVVEWTVYLKNAGSGNTPILEKIQALDARFERSADGEYVLSYWKGDSCTPDSYQPLQEPLSPNVVKRFAPAGGRPSNGVFPCFNLQMPGGGLMLAVGWPGQWAAAFTRDAGRGLQIVAGQELTRLVLKPGEEIRTPLMALLFWQGTDRVRAHNLWRRWMLGHNLPRPAGRPLAPLLAFCSGGFFDGLKVSEASEKQFIDVLGQEGIQLDYWWMDAGWYPCDSWPQVGTWEPDPARFPKGLKAVSDYVHTRGMKLIVWFEPERVEPGSWLAKNHPGWLLGGKLLNLGNPEARQWLTDHVDGLLRDQGIDLYRQDFNMDPLGFWRGNDAPDRQGVTENLHLQGYLAYWDELRRRHPGLLIDSCASGGRRNDLETLRRAVPLLRSDYQSFQGDPGFALGNQCHTYGLASWFPFFGQGVYYNPDRFIYSARSYFSPAFGLAVDVRKPGTDWALYRRMISQWRQVAGYMLCDFYPLTPYSLQEDQWMAWQFNRPEQDDGLVQAFRRGANAEPARVFRLSGLDPAARYEITDLDSTAKRTLSGQDLMGPGLPIEIREKSGSILLTYRKSG